MSAATDDRPEVWMPVLGYSGLYEVSNWGQCRRLGSAKVLKPVDDGSGYYFVSLSANGVVENHRIHRLVLIAFCGREPFDGAIAAHNDGVPHNCRLTNLRWATPVENQADRIRHGTHCKGADVFGAKLDDTSVEAIRCRLRSGERNKPIAQDYGVSISTVHLIRHNRIWRHVA